jgi:hypothetical protein
MRVARTEASNTVPHGCADCSAQQAIRSFSSRISVAAVYNI